LLFSDKLLVTERKIGKLLILVKIVLQATRLDQNDAIVFLRRNSMKGQKKWLVVAVAALCVLASCTYARQSGAAGLGDTNSLKGYVHYRYLTDYLFRGLNISKMVGGHTGRGVHELIYGVSIDAAEFGIENLGRVGVEVEQTFQTAFAETNANALRTSIAVNLVRPCQLLDGMWKFEYRNYKFSNVPQALEAGQERTQEVTAALSFKDGELIQALTGQDLGDDVLNPVIMAVYDWEMADKGGIFLLGLSHPFDMTEVSSEMAGLTVTPSWCAVVDNHGYGPLTSSLTGVKGAAESTVKLAYMEWGLHGNLDLTELTGLQAGRVSLASGISYVQAIEKIFPGVLHDELYGYVGLNYDF